MSLQQSAKIQDGADSGVCVRVCVYCTQSLFWRPTTEPIDCCVSSFAGKSPKYLHFDDYILSYFFDVIYYLVKKKALLFLLRSVLILYYDAT